MSGSSKRLWKFWINFENLLFENELLKRKKLTIKQYIVVQIVVTPVLMEEKLNLLHDFVDILGTKRTFSVHKKGFTGLQ